jgi:predicted CXXCH cytochrome family protein
MKRGASGPKASAGAGAGKVLRVPRYAWVIGGFALLLVAGLAIWQLRGTNPAAAGVGAVSSPASGVTAAVARVRPAWVDNQLCVGCHQDAAAKWQKSHHFMAMALPTEASVRGDFANTTFKHQGVTSRFFRRADKFYVNTDGPDGRMADFEIKYTFGIDPLQQYLIELPGGRLQALTIAWDTNKKRWFHLYPKEKAPAGDVMHWTGNYQTGNTMCIECHATGYEKRYDAKTGVFDTRWTEINVSCQSCHGAGQAHVAWAQALPPGSTASAAAAASAPPNFGLTVDLKLAGVAGATVELEVCAACHSRRSDLTAGPMAGEPLLDNFLPARLVAPLYHADGQQREEVYFYASMRQSKMFRFGVRCTDCHDAHTGKLKVEGNGVCLQCHQTPANPRFPTAAGNFDTPAHHHHQPSTPGAQCLNCHMPITNYMIVHPRPDHSMRVPRPDLNAATGAPDACTACHKDKPATWAAAATERWYGTKRRQMPHFGPTLAAAQAGAPGADAALARLAADPANPAIVRASALAALRIYPSGHETERIEATRDADAEVRAAAVDSLENFPPAQRVQALAPLLRDPVRAVRSTAARALSSVDPASFDAATRLAFDAALADYIAAQNVSLDMPGARLNLAVIYQNTGRPDQAEAEYLAALRLDPDFTQARANLAQFYGARARLPDAERVLAEGAKRVPAQGELQYSLGLVLAEQGRMPEAAAALGRAATLLPDRARVRYNLGLALQQTGKRAEAQRAFTEAYRLDPRDPAVPYALALLYANDRRWSDALMWAERMQSIAPANPRAAQLVQRLRALGGAAGGSGG